MLSSHTTDFFTALECARTADDLWSMTAGYLEGLGLTHSIYTYVDPQKPEETQAWTSLSANWQDRYLDQNYQKVDPFYRYCCRSYAPVATGPAYLDRHDFLNDAERRIVLEGGETGFVSGFSAPVRLLGSGGGFGGWNFGSGLPPAAFEALLKAHGKDLRLAGFYIHEHAARFSRDKDLPRQRTRPLSARERECLLWLGRGLRTAAIADRLDIAQVTVDLHFRGARRKLQAATREEALVKAILGGQINP